MKKILYLLALLLPFVCYSQEYIYKHYDVASGLSNNKVNTIYKDSQGFIWVGTASGLNRFDGHEFKMYRSQKGDETTPSDNYIESIQELDNGDLIVKSGTSYIRYDRRHDAFVRHIECGDSLFQPSIVYVDKAKNVWFYDRYRGVNVKLQGAKSFKRVSDRSGLLTNKEVTDIKQVGSDVAFVNNCGELIFVDVKSCAVVRHVATSPVTHSGRITTAYCDDSNRLWIYDLDALKVYDSRTQRVDERFSGKFDNSAVIRTVTQDASGKIWLGYDHKGLAIVDPNSATPLQLSDAESLKNITISALYTDSDGSVWIGTYKKGLYQYNEHMFKFRLCDFPDVNCIAGKSDETVWIGTDGGSLIRWNSRTNVSEVFADPISSSRDKAIVSLCAVDNVGVWVGTYRDGLKYFANGRFTRFGLDQGLANENVWSIVNADYGRLWIGTLGGGLQLFDTNTCKFETYNTRNTKLISDYINTLCKGSDGKLYIGTPSGISVMNIATGEIVSCLGSHDGVKSFVNPGIVQIYEDSRGLIWIATCEGLYYYDRSTDNLQQISGKTGYQNQFILGITEDLQGNMWVSIGASLFKITVKSGAKNGDYDFAYNAYNQNDGIQNSDFNQRSFHRLSNGEILVGGLYGINVFSPQSVLYSGNVPKVIFTDLNLYNQSVKVGDEYDGIVVLTGELNSGETVNLTYKFNDFTVYFAADNYIDSEDTEFYYRLVGFNSEWIKCAPNMHQATYTNLPYGEYKLEVKAVNADGTESLAPATLTIVVHPPFWLSIWAKLLYALIAVAVIFYILKFVKRRERAKYQEQKKEEAIKQQEEIAQMKFRFFTNISHELRTPLTLILSPLESMLKEVKDDKQHRRLEIIHGNANRLLYLVNQLLDFRKNEMAGLNFRPDEGDVVAYVKNLCESFDGFLENKNVQLTFFSSNESLMMSFDADKLGKIILNLLSNAFKFTPDGGRVDVAMTQVDGKLIIKVADTGIGIDDKDKPMIFERFYQTDSSKSGGSGIGLSLVNEYVKLHDGTVEVVDNVGGGSVFIITLPIRHINVAKSDDDKADNKAELEANDNRPTALIVDDNADLRTFLSEELSNHCQVITAANGREALDIVEKKIPDIIVTDLMMPVMDGIELCRQLKGDKKYSSIPVIVLSAKHDDRAKVEGLTIGADDYITKPFNCDVLMLRINKLLELSRKGVQRSLIDPEPTPIKVTSLDEKLIESAVKYVEENMDRADLSVEELSRHLGMSRVHLYKRMRQVTGKTPIEFIRVLRLKRAAQLLRESQLNVSEIAYQVGFNNPKYFSTYFKEEFGVLPSVYQEKEGK